MVEDSPAMIPLCVPEIRGNEWQYVKDCLDTNWVSSVGGYVDRFEEMVAAYTGREHAIATVNGTAALHVALLVAGIEPDDEVLVPSLTFIAPANAVRYMGAWPVFIDADPEFGLMDCARIKDFIAEECSRESGSLYNKSTGRRVKGLLPVHILGHPVDMDPLVDLARGYDLTVVCDATECLGAKYKGDSSSHLGDIACFSFNGNKVITTGGGGMVVTDNEAWADRVRYLTTQAKDDPVEYIHGEVGYNYRLTNVQAAMGVAQMEVLDDYVVAKRRTHRRYLDGFAGLSGIELLGSPKWAESIYWLSTIRVNDSVSGVGSRDLMRVLKEEQIDSRPLWHPLHGLKPFVDCARYGGDVAEDLYSRCLSLPSSVGLSEDDQNRVIRCICQMVRP